MNINFKLYIALWSSLCLVALIIFLRDSASFVISSRQYRRFIFTRWKLVTFVFASAGMTVMAPYTGDPTWDYFDAFYMSALTYLTAPWVVGTLYRAVQRKIPFRHAYVAFCLWMFSASWSYDLYILLRDGEYPYTWLPNIFASSFLYLMGGLFWSIDWKEGRGVHLSFVFEDWPGGQSGPVFLRILWITVPIMLLIATLMLQFLLWPAR